MNLIRPPLGGHPRWCTANHASVWLAPTAIWSFSLGTGTTHHESGG